MKIFKSIILLLGLILILSLATNIISAGNITVKLIKEEAETDSERVFLYEYQIGEEDFKQLNVFVNNLSGIHIIKVGSKIPNMKTEYVYNTLGGSPNFMNIILNIEDDVNSLQEATDLAVSHFLKNN